MTTPHANETNRIIITNRELFDMVRALEDRIEALNSKIVFLTTINTLLMGVLGYLIIEGLK